MCRFLRQRKFVSRALRHMSLLSGRNDAGFVHLNGEFRFVSCALAADYHKLPPILHGPRLCPYAIILVIIRWKLLASDFDTDQHLLHLDDLPRVCLAMTRSSPASSSTNLAHFGDGLHFPLIRLVTKVESDQAWCTTCSILFCQVFGFDVGR